jgi:RNA polymerase sigma-70 factor (ECF subfamily)
LKIVGEKPIAEDIAQNVFMKFWLSMDRFQIEDYKAYIFIMARNEAITHLRKEKLTRNVNRHLVQYHVQGINLTEGMILQKETEALLQKAIQHLSPQRKKVYVLCKMEGLSYAQAGKIMGISISTVRELLRLSNQQIRNCINSHFGVSEPKPKPKQKLKKHKMASIKTLQAA